VFSYKLKGSRANIHRKARLSSFFSSKKAGQIKSSKVTPSHTIWSVHWAFVNTLSRLSMPKNCGFAENGTSLPMQEHKENSGGQPHALHNHVS
jgi:hypothetical protein